MSNSKYIIQCRHASGSSHWSREPDTDEYATIDETEAIIAKLETQDEDGAPLEYRAQPA